MKGMDPKKGEEQYDQGERSTSNNSNNRVIKKKTSNPRLPSDQTSTRVLRNRSVSREPPQPNNHPQQQSMNSNNNQKPSKNSSDSIGYNDKNSNSLKRSLNRFENPQPEPSGTKRPVLWSRNLKVENEELSTPSSTARRLVNPAPPSTIRSSIGSLSSHSRSQSQNTLLTHDRLRELSTKLERANRLISELESSNRQSNDRELSLERKALDHQRESRELLLKLKESDDRVKKLEQDRALVGSRIESDEKEKQSVIESATEELKRSKAAELDALDKLQSLKETNKELEERLRLLTHQQLRAQKLTAAAEEQARLLKEENLEAIQESERLRAQLSEERSDIEKLQQEKRQWQNSRGESTSSTTQPSRDVLRNELSRQVDRFKSLEQQNSRLTRELNHLRSHHSNSELLKEEIRHLKQRLINSDELRQKLAQTETELLRFTQERKEWSIFLGKHQVDLSNPHSFFKSFANLRIENASFMERLGSRELEIKSRDRMIGELEVRLEEVERERDEEFKEKLKFEAELQVAERNRDLDRRRIEMLNEQLRSYTAEEEVLSDGLNGFDKQRNLQVAHMEELLASHQAELSKVREEAADLRRKLAAVQSGDQSVEIPAGSSMSPGKSPAIKTSLKEQIDRNEELEAELDELSDENEMLKTELKSLELQVHHLERDLGRGEFNPGTTKVVCPDASPAELELVIRKSTIEALRAENAGLLRRLSKLEKGLKKRVGTGEENGRGGAGGGEGDEKEEEVESLVPRESLKVLKNEIERLESEVNKLTKARERLCEMYKDTTASYKRAMWEILGYNLEAVANGEFRLRSAFRDEPGSTMLFVPGKSDGCSMEYKPSSHLSFHKSELVLDCFKTWLVERSSLPCFTAALTLKLYESSHNLKD